MLTIVRHGRTPLNAQGRLQGRIDAELDDVGRQQARLIADVVGEPGLVVSSPLLRARQTAEAFGLPIQIDERWIELDYGELDGLVLGEIPTATWEKWRSDLDYRPPGGETIRELGARVRAAADALVQQAKDRAVVVVTHVSPIKAALAWGLDVGDEVSWKAFVGQASITRFSVGPRGVSLHSFNDLSHLADMPKRA